MHLCIEYANPEDYSDSINVKFKLRDNGIASLWQERVITAQKDYTIDDPQRFYGFGNLEEKRIEALQRINSCIDTINSRRAIINRRLEQINDFDTLNYLHHIFEVYHGLLDQQTNEFYANSDPAVQKALADLNICVHRCESLANTPSIRNVITYFRLPKTKTLLPEHYDLFTDIYEFGTVYLNYVEIGKTLEDLAIDNDQYIGDEAFKPFNFYSADFVVMYSDPNLEKILSTREKMKRYYLENANFFLKKGYHINHPHLRPGRIPLADIDSHGKELVQLLEHRQFVKSVSFE